ncbi:hypothetical protein A9Q95_16575 [Rhodobacterales bacterium 59_46_T64]|nr:hypothetical protein A9Q95_16575 [Rhodobacterales bacterium 59_46_T64]
MRKPKDRLFERPESALWSAGDRVMASARPQRGAGQPAADIGTSPPTQAMPAWGNAGRIATRSAPRAEGQKRGLSWRFLMKSCIYPARAEALAAPCGQARKDLGSAGPSGTPRGESSPRPDNAAPLGRAWRAAKTALLR